MNVYDYLYRGISTTEVHTSVAIEFHAEWTEDEITFKVSPDEAFDVVVLIALSTRLACGAALDVFEVLKLEEDGLQARGAIPVPAPACWPVESSSPPTCYRP